MTNKVKRENIKKVIDDFVQECTDLFDGISANEIKKYAIEHLQRINKNINSPDR